MANETRNRVDLGRANRRAVLAEVVLRGPLPRTEIARATALTAAAVSRITRDLIDAGLILELPAAEDAQPRGPGRRLIGLDLNPAGGFLLGVGVNSFSQAVVLTDLKNRPLARVDLKLSDFADPDKVIGRLVQEAEAMIARHVPDRRRLLGACFAMSGAVDPDAGVVRSSPYLRWYDVALGPRLEAALGMPVRIESLPVALTLAETRHGIARGMGNLLTVSSALGLGAGLLVDGRIARGHDFSVGLIGRMPSFAGGGDMLDMAAAGHGVLVKLLGKAADMDGRPVNELADLLLDAVARAGAGDAPAAAAIAETGGALGRALAPLAVMVRPEAVMIAGPLNQAPHYMEACRAAFADAAPGLGIPVLASAMTAETAGAWVALGEFLTERDLDLDSLGAVRAA